MPTTSAQMLKAADVAMDQAGLGTDREWFNECKQLENAFKRLGHTVLVIKPQLSSKVKHPGSLELTASIKLDKMDSLTITSLAIRQLPDVLRVKPLVTDAQSCLVQYIVDFV